MVPINHLHCGVAARTQWGCCHPCSLEYKTESPSRCYQLMCGLTTYSLLTCFVSLLPAANMGRGYRTRHVPPGWGIRFQLSLVKLLSKIQARGCGFSSVLNYFMCCEPSVLYLSPYTVKSEWCCVRLQLRTHWLQVALILQIGDLPAAVCRQLSSFWRRMRWFVIRALRQI
jgi:hypothetical protein